MQLIKYCPWTESVQNLLQLTFEMQVDVEQKLITLQDVDLSDFDLLANSVFTDMEKIMVRLCLFLLDYIFLAMRLLTDDSYCDRALLIGRQCSAAIRWAV